MEDRTVVVIGGGQAGLAAGRHLQRAGVDFTILDAEESVGDQWRRRWDSLRLFTPVRYDTLPDGPWALSPAACPDRLQTADYLARYARDHRLPVRSGIRVTRLAARGERFEVETDSAGIIAADAVIVATGATTRPFIPAFAAELHPHITQLHSATYRSPADLPAERILVVGYGTSGAEIAEELAAAGRAVTIAGRPTPTIPAVVLAVAGGPWWFALGHILTRRTPIGRRIAAGPLRGAPLIGISPKRLRRSGVTAIPRIDAVEGGLPMAVGEAQDVDAVVWCTGFRGDLDWVDVAGLAFDERGYPVVPFGRSPEPARLGFLGVPFQTGLGSHLLGMVGDEAARLVADLTDALAHPSTGRLRTR